MALHGLIKQ